MANSCSFVHSNTCLSGCWNLWLGSHPPSFCPQLSSLRLLLPALDACFFPLPPAAWLVEKENICFQPSVVEHGARPKPWILGPALSSERWWFDLDQDVPAPAKFNTQWRQTQLYPRKAPPKARHRQGSSSGKQGGEWVGVQGSRKELGREVAGGHQGLQTEAEGEEAMGGVPTAAHLLFPSRYFPFGLKITPKGLIDVFGCCFNWSSLGRVFSGSWSWRSLRAKPALPHPPPHGAPGRPPGYNSARDLLLRAHLQPLPGHHLPGRKCTTFKRDSAQTSDIPGV